MKKRILALALAGTTAFSVFGGAMSANAAWWDSSHVDAYDGSYYQSYNPAGTLTWGINTVGASSATIENTFYYPGTQTQYNRNTENGTAVPVDDVYMAPWRTDDAYGGPDSDLWEAMHDVTEDTIIGFAYFANYSELAEAYDYVAVTATADSNGVVTIGEDDTEYIIARNTTTNQYYIFDREVWEDNWGSNTANWSSTGHGITYDNVGVSGTFYLPENADINDNTSNPAGHVLATYENLKAEVEEDYDWYMINPVADNTTPTAQTLDTNMLRVTTDATVIISEGDPNDSLWEEDGSAVQYINSVDATYEDVMATAVSPDGVVYLYDYIDDLPIDDEDFADAWADGTLERVLAEETNSTSGSIRPETGYDSRITDLREDVIYAWEDFLDDLGISDHSNRGLTLWAEDTIENYAYTYRDSVVVVNAYYDEDTGRWTVTFGGSDDVDLYNFEQLIEDIMELAPADEAENAQTSNLVYLMQQYNRYVTDGFVDVNPVETDDWGDLLVALAQAPTEDEFRTTNRYNAYMDKVEDLVEQYEEADTSVAVRMAEEELYDFVTTYYDSYAVDERADTTVLATAIDNTYFNYDWRGKQNYSTDADGNLFPNNNGAANDDLVIAEYDNAWALYPIDDYRNYSGAYTGEYPGVSGTVASISNVTSEYGWFYNVYALAYDIYTGNRYQSVVDLMAETLNEAVDALTPSENAYASEILGAEEQNEELADLVETDYNSDMWANRNKIYTYVTERVSNDEIGHNGSDNAADIAELTYDVLGWQKYQTSVTRTDINSVKTAKSEAEAALKALQDDEDNYNAAQANALEAAIENCDYLIDLYNGEYSRSNLTQSVNTEYNAGVGDKDQLLKSMIDDAVQEVDDAINFAGIIMGWSQDDEGNWKYGTEEGYLNDGWHQVDGGKTWFYFNEDGTAKQSEWWQDGSTWYWFNSNCGAAVGWAKIDGDWYYFKGNNAMKTGWEKVEGSWYYMNSSGKMVTGWCQINGTWYYFSKESNALGQMLANTTTPDGYKVDANGALVE